MELTKFDETRLKELMGWFINREQIKEWGGPTFRYPVTPKSFCEDLKLTELESYALMEDGQRLCGFGQFYSKQGRLHLGRIAVSPEVRGRGVGRELVRRLIRLGASKTGAIECSLYVYQQNQAARRCYTALGFSESPAPTDDPQIPGCLFLTKPVQQYSDGLHSVFAT